MGVSKGDTLMSFYPPVWQNALTPNQGNIRQWLDNLYSKFQPIEQSRWSQSNIDSLFYAGAQTFINRFFGFAPTSQYTNFYFNLLQQPINLVTGLQRQNRKAIQYIPSESADPLTVDQYNKVISFTCNKEGIHEVFSKACEQSAITGMVLLQPYLDFTGEDPAQGQLKVKLWEYNSFLIDPFCRDQNYLTDCEFVWTQEYISKREAEERFPDKIENIAPMSGSPQRYGRFYFLPENYNMNRNDLMVLSYVWYKDKRKKKRLYSKSKNQFFDFAENSADIETITQSIPDLEVVTVDVTTWKVAVVLNDQLMYLGDNPLGFDECPFVMVPWNYEPHLNYYDLRARGLVRTMRDTQYLMNRQIIISHDQKESTINSGWKRKVGAVANEDNMKRTGQGWDILINEGYVMTDVEKIIPNSVPESDFALADRLRNLIFGTSGIDLENWSAQNDPQASSLTTMLKQAANLTVLQKYFDQWDMSLKVLGNLLLKIVQRNWSAEKIGMIIGEEPTPLFFSKIFAQYQVQAQEALLTPTQQNRQAQQMLEINQTFGREVFPASMVIKDMNFANKAEILQFVQQQEEQQSIAQQQQSTLEGAMNEARLKDMYAKAMNNLASARERNGRAQADIGLLEERLSMITRNRALATKDKMEALEKMVDVTAKLGEIETMLKMSQVDQTMDDFAVDEEIEKQQAERSLQSAQFATAIMGQQQAM